MNNGITQRNAQVIFETGVIYPNEKILSLIGAANVKLERVRFTSD